MDRSYQVSAACGRLFVTNEHPVGTQSAEIGESARIAQAVKASLDLQIAETRTSIETMRTKLAATEKKLLRLEGEALDAARHIESCQYSLAPIRRLPPETLANIFVCYLDIINDGSSNISVSHVRTGIWMLGHICAHWRAVALSTRLLWSYFVFKCPKDNSNWWRRQPDLQPMVQEFFRRAGNHPVTVDFNCNGSHDDTCSSILQGLLSCSEKWEVATFELSSFFYHRMHSIKNRLPILRELTLTVVDTAGDDPFSDFETFGSCPNLIRLTLALDFWYRGPVRYIHFPWHQLSHYSGPRTYANTDILTLAPTIIKCALGPGQKNNGLVAPGVLIHHLRDLTLLPNIPPDSLKHLGLPALEHLTLEQLSWDHSACRHSLTQLIRRSAAPLSITITGFSFPSEVDGIEMVDLLAAVPTVEHLAISSRRRVHQAWRSRVLSVLRLPSLDSTLPILPILKHLSLTCVTFDERFVDMVESRCVPGASGERLESLTLSDVDAIDGSHLLRLRQFEAQLGLKVIIN
ncbi:hypothetical protein FB451DRAFT_418741 [Mycena latifolia]|nr:hypothetical protein FB451DRAFT_418741 [Mycena latifolia]